MGKGITPRSEDYAAWYTEVISKAGLADYGPVRGTMVIRPYGFTLWELIKDALNTMIKETGHVNAYFPLFIPKSYLAQEAQHVDGFAKECAVVTHTRLKTDDRGELILDPESKLEEEVIIRPTSETVIWSMYKKWIQSYRDLPLLINQWANVVRWEMRTRLFLRTTEFLWQEGHTAHATAREAEEESQKMLEVYRTLAEDFLAVPVITGKKSESEKFAGAVHTYALEAMMGDKRALQAGTSHNLGQNFAKAFDVTYQNEANQETHVYATSWGVTTRLIGAVVMIHGDDRGLRLPPRIAPYQVVIVPIFRNEEQKALIQSYLEPVIRELAQKNIRVYQDWSDRSPGFKFNEWEMKGVPIRLEAGPKDVENEKTVMVRRDTGEKIPVEKDRTAESVEITLEKIQNNLYQEALSFREAHTYSAKDYDEFCSIINNNKGFVRCGWDGSVETEEKIKTDTKATIRVIPVDEKPEGLKCIYSGKPAVHEVIFAKAY